MSGSVRKRKSMWDSVEGTPLSSKTSEDSDWHGRASYSSLDRSHGPKWSDSEANDGLKSKDRSERPWESSQENYGQKDDNINRDLNEIPVITRSWDGDKSYRISPGYNGRGRQNHSRSPENSLSQSRRYRSRSRDRGQRKSRSRSRGRDRDDRNWSRSQSRSPLRDHRRESYGGTERKSGSGISSHPCKDFTVGKCRRGSQCRFLHQDNLNQMDAGRSERDRSERWRSRQEHGEPKDYHPPDKISDGYGNYDRRGGNSFFDHDRNRHPRRGGNSNPPCKFFAMGKCNRDNCKFSHDGPVPGNRERSSGDDRDGYNMADKSRFSHDGPVPGNRERSSGDDRDGYNMADKSKLWNGPKWGDDAHGVSDVAKSTGWGNSNYGNKDYQDPRAAEKQTDDLWGPALDDRNNTLDGAKLADEAGGSDARKTTEWGHPIIQRTAEKQTDDRRGKNFDDMNQSQDGPKLADETGMSDVRKTTEWGHNLDNQSRMLSSPVRDKAGERVGYMSTHWRNDDNGVNVGPPESTGGAKSFRGEDSLLFRQGSDSQTFDGIYTHVSKQTVTQEASGQQLATTVVNPGVSENCNIQPYDYKREQNVTIADDSNALTGVNISENITNQNGDNMGFQSPSLVENDPSGLIIPPSPQNRPIQVFSHLNLENQNEIHHRESFMPFEMLQSQVPQINSGIPPNVVTSDPLVQIPNLSASLTHIFGSGQELPQLYAALNPPNSVGMVPSLPNSASFAPPMDGQPDPATRVQEQKDPFGDSTEPKKLGNETHERSIPVPLNLIPNSEVKESNKITAEKWKQEKENDNPESGNEDGKVGEGYTGKDDKEMRLFKIALVEFVKEILKPTWKEGQMSREVHKAIVKKAVDKVTSTIQGDHIPKTQEKIDQYLSYSKPKITKLVQAYVERLSKN